MDDEILSMQKKFANFVEKKGLEMPAVLMLEAMKPVSFITSQAVLFFSPFVNMFTTNDKTLKISEFLSDRNNIENLIKYIEKTR